jgi:ubiquinone/menaquinone biosynthesis C-methylase UbiE
VFARGGPTFFELARQALSSTERGYDLLAPKFDATPFRTPDVALDAAAAFLGYQRVQRGLDLCCGTGAAFGLLDSLCEHVTGIDVSTGMLAQARAREGTHALARADALSLPFGESFDLVTLFGALGHILEADEPRLVDEVHRVLRPNGRFVVYTLEPPSPLTLRFWLGHGFNAVMRARNAVLKPEFVMYYLTFLVPRARALLEARGFHVEVIAPPLPRALAPLRLLIATKR